MRRPIILPLLLGSVADAFVVQPPLQSSLMRRPASLQPVDPDLEGVPIPFVQGTSFIECYADSIATVEGDEYTIGVPCDHAVALCYNDDEGVLVGVELDDPVMDDIFSLAENIVTEEFGDELVLQRTPQTLTLMGELESDDDERGLDDDEADEDDEEVEVLLSFEHRDVDYHLVRILDPVLLVGKVDPDEPSSRKILTEEESDQVMPLLEEMFMEIHDDPDTLVE